MRLGQLMVGLSVFAFAAAAFGYQVAPSLVLASGTHESGVTVELLEIARDSPTVVTVRWRYRNESDAPRQLTTARTGGIDPYRLSLNTYLLDENKKIKFQVSRDTDNHPVASRNGSPNAYIVIKPRSTIEAWGKYFVPTTTETVTVAVDGVAPFGGIKVPK